MAHVDVDLGCFDDLDLIEEMHVRGLYVLYRNELEHLATVFRHEPESFDKVFSDFIWSTIGKSV